VAECHKTCPFDGVYLRLLFKFLNSRKTNVPRIHDGKIIQVGNQEEKMSKNLGSIAQKIFVVRILFRRTNEPMKILHPKALSFIT